MQEELGGCKESETLGDIESDIESIHVTLSVYLKERNRNPTIAIAERTCVHAEIEAMHVMMMQTVTYTNNTIDKTKLCLLYTSPSPRDRQKNRMPSSA